MFNISQAVNKKTSRMNIGEIKDAIKLVKEVITNCKKYQKKTERF